jgi:hypothetical protein
LYSLGWAGTWSDITPPWRSERAIASTAPKSSSMCSITFWETTASRRPAWSARVGAAGSSSLATVTRSSPSKRVLSTSAQMSSGSSRISLRAPFSSRRSL